MKHTVANLACSQTGKQVDYSRKNATFRASLAHSNVARLIAAMLLAVASVTPVQSEVDVDAAQALAKKNACFKCHAIDKTKVGPAYKKVAARLKTKPDAVETIIEHITTGPMIELPDGTNEKHKIIDTKDPKELRNLAEWILSL